MERLRQLIKEALSNPPKKDDCNCGCHSCDNIGNPGVVLNESIAKPIILTENLQYHVQNKLPLTENTFRYGSQSFLDLWSEARYLYVREIIHVNEDDKSILEETSLGEYGMYEGKKVPLDLPMLGDEVTCPKCSHSWEITPEDDEPMLCHNCGYNVELGVFDIDAFKNWKKLNEAKKKEKKKNPPLGKPKRGGSKKFYVYVKNPKTKKIKKVSFGDTSGLSAKINNPEARRAFAARHDCKNKKDKTKASYWSCRLPRYAKLLGLKSSFSGFW
jgi:hypothetical protein